MTKSRLIIIFCFLTLLGCRHKVEYAGHVYSKHNYPVANAHVGFQYNYRSYTDGGILEATTDANGYFHVQAKLQRSSGVSKVRVSSDSGSYESSPGPNNTGLEIILK